MNALQEKMLATYKCVASICEKNNIRYFAIGGTAIGAIRHSGFIPWDDDLDIAIPVEQYDAFIEALQKDLPEPYIVVSHSVNRHYGPVFLKVVDTTTTFIEEYYFEYPDTYYGLWIDVMPMGGIPSPGLRRKLYSLVLRILVAANDKTRVPFSFSKTIPARIFWLLFYPLRPLNKTGILGDLCIRFAKRRPFYNADYVGYTWTKLKDNLIFPFEWFKSDIKVPFEDTSIPCPKGYDEMLTHQFGDYMTEPEESERLHHSGFIDLEHSFREYQAGKRAIPSDRNS